MKNWFKKTVATLLTAVLTAGIIAVPGITANAAAIGTGTLVTFGQYPQSRVTDTSLINNLNSQTLIWQSYDYCVSNTQDDFMMYADVTLSGEKYRAVHFSHYRAIFGSYSSESDNTYQDDYGYEPNNVYWFKYEPIIWRVLDVSSGLLMAENIIDSQPLHKFRYINNGFYGDENYCHYASNWAYSSLRSWLNNDFYNLAFSTEKSFIYTVSLTTPSSYDSTYDADPTNDKIYLLSQTDVLNTAYGFSSKYKDEKRIAYGTDYAKCQGLYKDNIYNNGASDWLLRTPHLFEDTGVVSSSGSVSVYSNGDISRTYGGVRPALNINIGSAISQSIITISDKPGDVPIDHTSGHIWDSGVEIAETTCIKDGVMTYTCTVCGETKTEVILATGAHKFGSWNFTVVPTYRDGGAANRTCTVCGYVDEKTFDPLVPDYTVRDPDTGVEIDYMEETYDKRKVDLEVTSVFDGDSYNFLNKEKGNFDFKIYDIKTKIDDAPVQPNGKVLVKLPIPENYDRSKLRIYHVTSGGVVEPVDMWIDGDYACFEASHFSAYAIVDESKSLVDYGDVNGDGKILADDARLALRASARLENLDIVPSLVADVNGDGNVHADDARQILRFSAKLQKEFERSDGQL